MQNPVLEVIYIRILQHDPGVEVQTRGVYSVRGTIGFVRR